MTAGCSSCKTPHPAGNKKKSKTEGVGRGRSIGCVRRTVQAGVLLSALAAGIQFLLYVDQAAGRGAITIPRPAGVEGFLPIGALMGWKRFFLTGSWDPVHPAAMVILGFAVLIAFFLRKSFCGWFCPVGTVSEMLAKMGRRLFKHNFRLPPIMDILLRSVKYGLLAFFLWVIAAMPTDRLTAFLGSPYYRTSDVRMLYFFLHISATTAVVLAVLAVFSIFIANFWCRYLCPYGALLGILAAIGPTRIARDADKCRNCGECTRVCPGALPVDRKHAIISPECTACMRCVAACPAKEALGLKTRGIRVDWSGRRLGAVIVGIFVAVVYLATISGHWESHLSNTAFRAGVHHLVAAAPRPPDVGHGYRH